jgi:hypothetical protein
MGTNQAQEPHPATPPRIAPETVDLTADKEDEEQDADHSITVAQVRKKTISN